MFSNFVKDAFVFEGSNEINLLHLRYEHLNVNGLRLLRKNKWSLVCQKSVNLIFVKDVILKKQNRNNFLLENLGGLQIVCAY